MRSQLRDFEMSRCRIHDCLRFPLLRVALSGRFVNIFDNETVDVVTRELPLHNRRRVRYGLHAHVGWQWNQSCKMKTIRITDAENDGTNSFCHSITMRDLLPEAGLQ